MKPVMGRARGVWLVVLTLVAASSCQRSSPPSSAKGTAASRATEAEIPGEKDEQIVAFCGGCHAMPKPSSFPKSAWYDEVKRGFDFYHQSKRKDLSAPPLQSVVDYFRTRAPASLVAVGDPSISNPEYVRFRKTEVVLPRASDAVRKPVATSFVGVLPSERNDRFDLIFSDMANGGTYRWLNHEESPSVRQLAVLRHPAVMTACDLNGNGRRDLVFADLGSFNPADHDRGRVMWLPDVDDNSSTHELTPLAEGLGRVADVQAADFDGDGDLDLVVAEFGWHKTGRILWLENEGDANSPRFKLNVIDARPGAIHVPVIDLNRDGKPDFVALISQEFEVVEAFLNRGDGSLEKKMIHAAGDPAFGSSGIKIIDMDGDGDDDVLYTNGDMFDSFLVKPYHEIQWLENRGEFPFVPHRLTAFPGVHRALAGDLDRDGDLDIVAGAFLPATVRESDAGKKLDSLIWLEQTRPGEFIRHSLEVGNCIHAAMELTDLNGDGHLDIAVGNFRDQGSADQSAVTIWWNETSAP